MNLADELGIMVIVIITRNVSVSMIKPSLGVYVQVIVSMV